MHCSCSHVCPRNSPIICSRSAQGGLKEAAQFVLKEAVNHACKGHGAGQSAVLNEVLGKRDEESKTLRSHLAPAIMHPEEVSIIN